MFGLVRSKPGTVCNRDGDGTWTGTGTGTGRGRAGRGGAGGEVGRVAALRFDGLCLQRRRLSRRSKLAR